MTMSFLIPEMCSFEKFLSLSRKMLARRKRFGWAIHDVISGFSKIFKLSHFMTTRWPKIVYFFEKNIFSRLGRHRRGKIVVFASTGPCYGNGLIDIPVYMTTRWPKMVIFVVFHEKYIFPWLWRYNCRKIEISVRNRLMSQKGSKIVISS